VRASLRRRGLPSWLSALLFLVPLVWSEYMFYVAGRWHGVVLFPVLWVAFWLSLSRRRGEE